MAKILFICLRTICFVFVFIELMSCSIKEEQKLGEKLLINVGTEYIYTGLVDKSGEEHLCFLKRQFKPNVKIYNKKGLLTDSIPLIEAEKILGNINHIWMNSVDSVYAYSNFNYSLVLVDRKGKILFSDKSYPDLMDVNGNYYSFYLSYPFLGFTPTKHNVLFFRTYMNEKSDLSYIQRLEKIRRNGFLICKHNFTNQNKTFGFRFTDIVEFSTLPDSGVYFYPYFYPLIVNDQIFLFSEYSRYIYVLSDTLSILNTIKVIRDEDPIAQPAILELGQTTVDHEGLLLQQINTVEVVNIVYNSLINNYWIIVKNGEVKNRNWHNYPFKIQIYDDNFVKLKEVEVDSYDYIPRKSFVMNGKLYVEKNNSSNNNTREYEVIEL